MAIEQLAASKSVSAVTINHGGKRPAKPAGARPTVALPPPYDISHFSTPQVAGLPNPDGKANKLPSGEAIAATEQEASSGQTTEGNGRLARATHDVGQLFGRSGDYYGIISRGLKADKERILAKVADEMADLVKEVKNLSDVYDVAADKAALQATVKRTLRRADSPGWLRINGMKSLADGAERATKLLVNQGVPLEAAKKIAQEMGESKAAREGLEQLAELGLTALGMKWVTLGFKAVSLGLLVDSLNLSVQAQFDPSKSPLQRAGGVLAVGGDVGSFAPIPFWALFAQGLNILEQELRDSKSTTEAVANFSNRTIAFAQRTLKSFSSSSDEAVPAK